MENVFLVSSFFKVELRVIMVVLYENILLVQYSHIILFFGGKISLVFIKTMHIFMKDFLYQRI